MTLNTSLKWSIKEDVKGFRFLEKVKARYNQVMDSQGYFKKYRK